MESKRQCLPWREFCPNGVPGAFPPHRAAVRDESSVVREAERVGETGHGAASLAAVGRCREARHRAMPPAARKNQQGSRLVLAGAGGAAGDDEHLGAGDECWAADLAAAIES